MLKNETIIEQQEQERVTMGYECQYQFITEILFENKFYEKRYVNVKNILICLVNKSLTISRYLYVPS